MVSGKARLGSKGTDYHFVLLQKEEDDENDDFLAILSIIRFRLRNGKHKSSTSLLFKFFHEEESDKKYAKTTRA
uniref:Uncharacterized protein n=1 Tax=Daphnia galeata TaxID=27404 RepID=A0A8J2RKQ6_9CRUS|nr:unnamed protein product [Daphnia galeata]